MSNHLPSHLEKPDVVSSEEAAQILKDTAEVVEDCLLPFIGKAQRIMDSAFVEWRGEGKNVFSPDGKAMFDCVGGGGVFGLGFAHPDIVEAVVRQARRGGLVTRSGFVPGQVELAQKLQSLVPESLHYVYYGNSGTEALEAAIKLARVATGKTKLIGTHLGYHGMSIGTISLSGIGMWRDGIGPYVEATTLVHHGDLTGLEAAIDDDTAAVVLEPIQWASGCKVVDKNYFKEVKALCEKHGALLILDEVQTGLGRTGKKFAMEHWEVTPDILCVGKILSGGMVPISAVLYTEQIHKAERMRPLFNNSSFGGNALACAAAITTINLLQDRYFERAEHLGNLLATAFDELVAEFPAYLVGYHGHGLMRCLEFSAPIFGAIFGEWLRRDESILVAAMSHIPQFVRVSPPFICEDSDIDQIKEGSRRVLRAMSSFTPQQMFEDFSRVLQEVQREMAEPIGSAKGAIA